MKKYLLILVFAGIACAQPASYNKCIGCHGANGEKVALGKSKKINEMTKQEIVDSLKGYQNGTYGGAMKGLMVGQAKTLSDGDIKAIAEAFGK